MGFMKVITPEGVIDIEDMTAEELLGLQVALMSDQNVRGSCQIQNNKEQEIEMNWTQYICPDCGYKTAFAHYNTSLAELRKHRERERAIALHPAGKKL